MTDLYEAGDINQADDGDDDFDDVDDVDDIDDVDEADDADDGVGAGNERGTEGEGTSTAVLSYLARSLSNDPDAVVIDTDERRGGLRLSLHVAPEDMGRVIGRRGRTAQAIRTLVNVAAAKDGVQANVDIVDD
ncbi:MAG TPA: KH domain-containing protein [Acidimicrobiales bacterium]|nr:KH domain-containing protein [Acidimicrobiales bacterium]